jgi:transcriptional regulator with XRE-family HTH domain
MATDDPLAGLGARLRALRLRDETTLATLAERTGISVSTLSRLESGQRRPTLELLLPLAKAYRVSLDELVDAPPTGDPRIHGQPITQPGMTIVPLTNRPGGVRAYKLIVSRRAPAEPELRTHEGYEWLYVLDGKLRLALGEHDLTLGPGEAAEFDTRVPHWFGCADKRPVEVLSLFGPQGERMHLRARPRKAQRGQTSNL